MIQLAYRHDVVEKTVQLMRESVDPSFQVPEGFLDDPAVGVAATEKL